jgi:ATP-dependent RNA helicase DeaD
MLTSIEKATRQPLTQMQLPSVENVNATRLTRFDDAITAALEQAGRIEGFRDIIGHYVEHHDVPEVDVAAALAVVAQGDTPLLLSEEDERREQRAERDRRDRERDERGGAGRGSRDARRDRGDRREFGGRADRSGRDDRAAGPERRTRPASGPMAMYRIAVGKRQKVEPRQIVGALANEGGLSRQDFGAIDIRPDFSLVELPAQLSDDVLGKLSGTRIGGKLIQLQPDQRGGGARGDARGDDDRPPRKPRHH